MKHNLLEIQESVHDCETVYLWYEVLALGIEWAFRYEMLRLGRDGANN